MAVGAWRGGPASHGIAQGAAVLLGGALASLTAGTGALELDAWRGYAAAVPGGQAFITAGVGAALAAAWAAPGAGAARLAAAPLTALLVLSLRTVLLSPGLAAGAAVVAALLAFGGGLGRSRAAAVEGTLPPWSAAQRALLALAIAVMVSGGPIAVALLATAAVAWQVHATRRHGAWWGLPLATTLLVGTLGWLLLTVAGTPLAMLRGAQVDVPLSAAAERLVGNLWLALVVVLAGPWPLARQGLALRTAPLAVAVAWAGAALVTPDGLAAWRPLATVVLVPLALVAAGRRDRAGMVGAVAGLLALQGTALAVGAALLVLAWPVARGWAVGNTDRADRVTLHAARVGEAIMALGLALVPMVILPDEVLLGTLLAAGLGLLLPAWGGAAESR